MAEKQPIKGRRRLSMKRIEAGEERLITFTKWRDGIYKKASEIGTLCGSDVGVLMFSPAGKLFSYGFPNLEATSAAVLHRDWSQHALARIVAEARRRKRLEGQDKDCDQLTADLRGLKKEGGKLEAGGIGRRRDVPVDDLKADEMEKMTETMEEVKKNADMRREDLKVGNAAFVPSSSASSSSSTGFVSPPYNSAGAGGYGFDDALPAFDGDGYGMKGYYC